MEVALGADETGAVIASFPIVGTLGDGSPVLDQLDPDRALDVARPSWCGSSQARRPRRAE